MHGLYFVTSRSVYDVGSEGSAHRGAFFQYAVGRGAHKSYTGFIMYFWLSSATYNEDGGTFS
jgi:hypothetical protein